MEILISCLHSKRNKLMMGDGGKSCNTIPNIVIVEWSVKVVKLRSTKSYT